MPKIRTRSTPESARGKPMVQTKPKGGVEAKEAGAIKEPQTPRTPNGGLPEDAKRQLQTFGAGEVYRGTGGHNEGRGGVVSRFENVMSEKLLLAEKVQNLRELMASGEVGTALLNSGVQLSGVLSDIRLNASLEPIFLKFKGPTQLSVDGKEVEGQGGDYHRGGYSSPIGPLANGTRLSELDANGLSKLGIIVGERVENLEFASGIMVSGKVESVGPDESGPLILAFSHCTVTHEGEKLFRPDWGTFDMVVGESVAGVSAGPADRAAYERVC